MKLNLDSTTLISFPSASTIATWCANWSDSLIAKLQNGASYSNCQDAVMQAFKKLLGRVSPSDFKEDSAPQTEAGWYGWISWQAKGALSHMKEADKARNKYHHLAVENGFYANECSTQSLDASVRNRAVVETLFNIVRKHGLKKANVQAYVRVYLYDEDAEKVAQELHLSVDNIYKVRERLEKRLAEEGPAIFHNLRRRYFLEAA